MGVTEVRQETKFSEGGERDRGHINSDRLRRGKKSTKVIINNVNSGQERAGRHNRVEESIDSGKDGCVGSYFVVYLYPVSAYRSSHSSLPQFSHLVPLLFHRPLKISRGFRGTHDRKEALICKCPFLAMRPANGGGEGEQLPCPVEVLSRRGQGSTPGG